MKKYNSILHGSPSRWDIDRKPAKGGGGTSTTTQEIPEELKPLATAYANKAIDLSGKGYTPYTGQRYADLNNTQNYGLNMLQSRAANGDATINNATGQLNNFISGNNNNPYLDQLVSKAQSSVVDSFNNTTKPQTEAAMRNAGGFGNSGMQQTMALQQKAAGQQMSDIATQMYGNAYNTNQANQMQAIGMAPTFGNQAYTDAQQMLNAGQIKQDQEQQNLDYGYQQYQDAQNLPYKQLAAMSGVFGSNLGASSTTQSTGGGK
jgi:hypothetical protein